MHDIDVCLFEQVLFITDLIKNFGLKLVNSIKRGLNFPTVCIMLLFSFLVLSICWFRDANVVY